MPFDEHGAVRLAPEAAATVDLRLLLESGEATARFWTCDLTAEYIRLNADYTT